MEDEDKAIMEDEKVDISNAFQKAYGWFVVVNRVTDNDITKHDFIYKKNITEVLNQLCFLIDYDKEQIRLQKKAQNGF